MKQPDKKLVLENGSEFYGFGFGADRPAVCEIVFNTGVVGYQEILSDLSYTEQMVVMTYPLIGNYGITDEDFEARTLNIGGLIVREYCDTPSNFRYTKTISEVMEENDIPGISGVDTRMITRIIRDEGSQKAAIVDAEVSTEEALKMIATTPENHDVVRLASCNKRWYSRTPNHRFDVVAIDCGIKYNTIRALNRRGCNVVIVPFDTPLEEIMAFNPDGIFISNGPGSPYDVPNLVDLIKQLHGRLPIFGINLGHLLIALSYGAKVTKQKFGNYASCVPVRHLLTNHIETASMGFGYTIEPESLEATPLDVTHVNVLNGSIVGVECKRDKVFSVQYHPEGAPGPQDSAYLFDKFIKLMEK